MDGGFALRAERMLEDSSLPQGVFGARLCVFVCSAFLICFYTFQYQSGKCNLNPLYVQGVTAIVYSLSTFGDTSYLFLRIENWDGEIVDLALGQYLFWMMTCPVIISNINTLLNLLAPEEIDLGRITFMMVKDIVLMAFGVLGAIQTDMVLKYAFIVASFLISFWLLYDLYHMARRNRKYFIAHERCWEWILIVLTLFVTSWAVFPVLYMLGPPAFNIISPAADKIGNSVGDLFAKNIFGFCCWYVRFVVLAPHVKKLQGLKSVTPYGLQAVSAKQMLQDRNDQGASGFRKRKPLMGRRAPKVLIVESRVELQRLFMHMLKDAGVHTEFAFDLRGAANVIKREHLGAFDAILANLTGCFENRLETQRFRMVFRRKPYYLPILGYTFDEMELGPLLEREERERVLCDGIIHHALDEWHIADLVLHWKSASQHWKDIDISADIERKLYDHVQGHHANPLEIMDESDDGNSHAGTLTNGDEYMTAHSQGAVPAYIPGAIGNHGTGALIANQQPRSRLASRESVTSIHNHHGHHATGTDGVMMERRTSAFEYTNRYLKKQLAEEQRQLHSFDRPHPGLQMDVNQSQVDSTARSLQLSRHGDGDSDDGLNNNAGGYGGKSAAAAYSMDPADERKSRSTDGGSDDAALGPKSPLGRRTSLIKGDDVDYI